MSDTDEIIVDAEYEDLADYVNGSVIAPITAPDQIRDEETRGVVLELANDGAYSGLSLPVYGLPAEPVVSDPRSLARRKWDDLVVKIYESDFGIKRGWSSRRAKVLRRIQTERVAAELDARISWLEESLSVVDAAAATLREQYAGIAEYKQTRERVIGKARKLLTKYEDRQLAAPQEIIGLRQDAQRDSIYANIAAELEDTDAVNSIKALVPRQEQELHEQLASASRESKYLGMIIEGYQPDLRAAEADLITLEQVTERVSEGRLRLQIALDRAKNYAARKVEVAQAMQVLSEVNRMTASLNTSIGAAEVLFDAGTTAYLSQESGNRAYSLAEDTELIEQDLTKKKENHLKQGEST